MNEEKKIIDEDKPTYNELEKLCYLLSEELAKERYGVEVE